MAMVVELNSELEGRISDAIQAGRFETPGQLVEVAIRRLLESLAGSAPAHRKRLSLDPPLIPPAGRRLDLTNERIYELIELP
ncbi:MAG: hypothetical protein ABUS49_04880 [Acidobacteriota bacterium]